MSYPTANVKELMARFSGSGLNNNTSAPRQPIVITTHLADIKRALKETGVSNSLILPISSGSQASSTSSTPLSTSTESSSLSSNSSSSSSMSFFPASSSLPSSTTSSSNISSAPPPSMPSNSNLAINVMNFDGKKATSRFAVALIEDLNDQELVYAARLEAQRELKFERVDFMGRNTNPVIFDILFKFFCNRLCAKDDGTYNSEKVNTFITKLFESLDSVPVKKVENMQTCANGYFSPKMTIARIEAQICLLLPPQTPESFLRTAKVNRNGTPMLLVPNSLITPITTHLTTHSVDQCDQFRNIGLLVQYDRFKMIPTSQTIENLFNTPIPEAKQQQIKQRIDSFYSQCSKLTAQKEKAEAAYKQNEELVRKQEEEENKFIAFINRPRR